VAESRKPRSLKSARRKKAAGDLTKARCRIVILGIGGAGNDIVGRLVKSGITVAECIAVNTDLKDLNSIDINRKVSIGEKVTRGLSAHGNPEIGRAALEDSRSSIESLLENADMAFVAAGLGGGTGTGAAPLVADIARRKGVLVLGVVTTPLRIGKDQRHRLEHAASALNTMRGVCDTVVVVDSNRFMKSVSPLPIAEVFKVVNQTVANMITSIVETISMPSLINLDLTDFRNIVRKGGVAVLGVGESDSLNRAEEAVKNALMSPLFGVDYTSAKGALIHVSGDPNMTIQEANRVGEIVTGMIGHDANIVWGARADPRNEGGLTVTLVMTGLDSLDMLNWFRTMMPELYNIESSFSEPEKSLPIDIGLEQIENYED
jgi:cell division protein FtsZ